MLQPKYCVFNAVKLLRIEYLLVQINILSNLLVSVQINDSTHIIAFIHFPLKTSQFTKENVTQ